MAYYCDKDSIVQAEKAYGNSWIAFCTCGYQSNLVSRDEAVKLRDAHSTSVERAGYKG